MQQLPSVSVCNPQVSSRQHNRQKKEVLIYCLYEVMYRRAVDDINVQGSFHEHMIS